MRLKVSTYLAASSDKVRKELLEAGIEMNQTLREILAKPTPADRAEQRRNAARRKQAEDLGIIKTKRGRV